MALAAAICARCGADKAGYDHMCPQCGHRPSRDGLLVAWLLSDAHLDADQRRTAAERIRAGKAVRPSDAQLAKARRAITPEAGEDGALSWRARAGLLATSAALTPLVGLTLWAWWRDSHPRQAREALVLSLPVAVLGFVGMIALLFRGPL